MILKGQGSRRVLLEGGPVDVYWVTDAGLEEHPHQDLKELLERDGGFVWVDIPQCDEFASKVLSDVFGFHPLAIRDCQERTHVPKVHAYPDHVLMILHAPEIGKAGHVHLVELDQIVSPRYLVTVHGPLGIGVPLDIGLRETTAVSKRIQLGRVRPQSPFELSYAIVSALARQMEDCVKRLAGQIAGLEQRVMVDDLSSPESLIEELFLLRHEMVTIATMAGQSRQVYARVVDLPRIPDDARPYYEDLANQFDAIRSLADGEERFLHGVVDFYQTRVATDLNVFAKRLTSVGAVLVTATLMAGIWGMNFRHMPELDWRLGYPIALGLMVVVSLFLVWFFRRKNWL
jgi:magnesium transporter